MLHLKEWQETLHHLVQPIIQELLLERELLNHGALLLLVLVIVAIVLEIVPPCSHQELLDQVLVVLNVLDQDNNNDKDQDDDPIQHLDKIAPIKDNAIDLDVVDAESNKK